MNEMFGSNRAATFGKTGSVLMRFDKSRSIRLMYVAAFFSLSSIGCQWFKDIRAEQGSKREWSILQAYELQNRSNKSTKNTILVSDSGYRLVGIINEGTTQPLVPRPEVDRLWILLNPKYPPYLKILGPSNAKYHITNDELTLLTRNSRTNVLVANELAKHIK
jgi:hypothetical protein